MGASISEKAVAKELRKRAAKYSEVVSRAELQTIALRDASFFTPSDFYPIKSEIDALKYGYSVAAIEIGLDDDEGTALGVFTCSAYAKQKRKTIILCKAKYYTVYDGLSGCDEDAIKAFVSRVGRFACYPYFRTLVSSFAWNAGLEMPILPVMKSPPRRTK